MLLVHRVLEPELSWRDVSNAGRHRLVGRVAVSNGDSGGFRVVIGLVLSRPNHMAI